MKDDDLLTDRTVELFAALADAHRLAILEFLRGGEQCVHEIAQAVQMEQSAVSHQLRALRDRGLVEKRRDGRHAFYSLSDDHVRAVIDTARKHVRHAIKARRR